MHEVDDYERFSYNDKVSFEKDGDNRKETQCACEKRIVSLTKLGDRHGFAKLL